MANLVGVCGIGIIWVLELFANIIRQLIRSIQSPHEACIMLPSQTAPQAKRQCEALLIANAQDITVTTEIGEVSSDIHAYMYIVSAFVACLSRVVNWPCVCT